MHTWRLAGAAVLLVGMWATPGDGAEAMKTGQGHGGASSPFQPSALPSIQAMAVVKPGTVLAGSFGMGMFRSEDRGQTWVPANEGLTDDFVLALTTGPDDTVYAGTVRAGIFRSGDGGETWHQINKGLKRLQVKALLATDRGLFAGTGNGVYRFNVRDEEWVVVTSGLDDILVHCLVMAADGSLYAGTSGKGVLQHTAHTAGWKRLTAGLIDHEGMRENFIRVLAVDQHQSLYAGTFDGGVFRSVDGGQHWTPITRALPNESIRGIVPTPAGLFVATGRGIYKSQNEGQAWVPTNNGLSELAVQVLITSADGALYAGTSAGAFRSDDNGGSWVAVNQGLEGALTSPFEMFR